METKAPLDENVPVTIVVTREVKPGLEPQFELWLERCCQEALKFPGHLGVTVIRPKDKAHPEYVTIFKFDHYSSLKRWIASDIRQKLLEESRAFAPEDPKVQILTGLESWFSLPDKPLVAPPPRYKMAVLSGAVIFPLSNLLPYASQPILGDLPRLVQSLVMTPLMVILMTYLVMPQVTRLFYRWLYSTKT